MCNTGVLHMHKYTYNTYVADMTIRTMTNVLFDHKYVHNTLYFKKNIIINQSGDYY